MMSFGEGLAQWYLACSTSSFLTCFRLRTRSHAAPLDQCDWQTSMECHWSMRSSQHCCHVCNMSLRTSPPQMWHVTRTAGTCPPSHLDHQMACDYTVSQPDRQWHLRVHVYDPSQETGSLLSQRHPWQSTWWATSRAIGSCCRNTCCPISRNNVLAGVHQTCHSICLWHAPKFHNDCTCPEC